MAKGSSKSGKGGGLKGLEDRLITKRRAAFSKFLGVHYDEFSALIMRVGAHWDEIAQWAIEEGHADAGFSGDAARKAYEREKSRREKSPRSFGLPSMPTSQPTSHTQDEAQSAPRVRKPLVMMPAKPLQSGQTPEDDGSLLPKPLGPVKRD